MQPLDALLTNKAEMWADIEAAIAGSKLDIRVDRDVDTEVAHAGLLALQVPAGNSLGSVIANTAGIAMEGGGLRFFGSPSGGAPGNMLGLLALNAALGLGVQQGILAVADDIYGNLFAVNLGGIDPDPATRGTVFMLSPAEPEWCAITDRYSDFLFGCFGGYWAELLQALGLDAVDLGPRPEDPRRVCASYYPPLFTAEGGVERSNNRLITAGDAHGAALSLRAALRPMGDA